MGSRVLFIAIAFSISLLFVWQNIPLLAQAQYEPRLLIDDVPLPEISVPEYVAPQELPRPKADETVVPLRFSERARAVADAVVERLFRSADDVQVTLPVTATGRAVTLVTETKNGVRTATLRASLRDLIAPQLTVGEVALPNLSIPEYFTGPELQLARRAEQRSDITDRVRQFLVRLFGTARQNEAPVAAEPVREAPVFVPVPQFVAPEQVKRVPLAVEPKPREIVVVERATVVNAQPSTNAEIANISTQLQKMHAALAALQQSQGQRFDELYKFASLNSRINQLQNVTLSSPKVSGTIDGLTDAMIPNDITISSSNAIYTSGTLTSAATSGTSTITANLSVGTTTVTGVIRVNGTGATSTFAAHVDVDGNLRVGGTCISCGGVSSIAGWTDSGVLVELQTASDLVAIGTSTPVSGAVVTVEATTTGAVPLALRGYTGQATDFFRILNASGSRLVFVSSTGGIFASSTLQAATTTIYGNLGVGTTTPAEQLSVAGRLYVGGSGTSTIENNLQVLGQLKVGTSSAYISDTQISATGNFTISTQSEANHLVLQTLGRVGVVSTTPWGVLSVEHNGANQNMPVFVIADQGTSTATMVVDWAGRIMTGTSTPRGWFTINDRGGADTFVIGSNTPHFTVKGGGNVGVGTSSPYALFSVNGAAVLGTTTLYGSLTLGSLDADPSSAVNGQLYYSSTDGAIRAYTNNTWGPLGGGFTRNSSTGIISLFNASDRLTIGTTSPAGLSMITAEASTTAAIPLTIRGYTSQTANLLQIANSSGTNLLFVNSGGGIFASSTLQVTGNSLLYGSLGVATSSPAATLAVQGNALISGTSTMGTLTATGSALFATAAGTNVGIGTTGPQAKLEVVNTSSAATATQLYLSNLASATNTTAQLAFRATDVGTTTAAQGNATTTAAINGVLNQNFNGGMGFLTFSTLRSGLLTEAFRIDGLGLLTFTNATATQLTTTGSTYLATTGGNVGIGTTTPAATFAVQGNLLLSGNITSVANVTATGTLTVSGLASFNGNASTTQLTTTGTTYLATTGGSVGIGTSTPGATLAVHGNVLVSGTSTVGTLTATGSALFATAAGTNVGIGTTSPQAKLEVVNTSSAATATQLYLSNLASATNTTAQLVFRANDVGTTTAAQGNGTTTAAINGVLNQNFNGGMGFLTFSTLRSGLLTEAFRIDGLGLLTFTNATATQLTTTGSTYLATTGGNVGIGTTSPYAALSVVGSTGVVAQHYTATSTTATSSFMGALGIGTSTPAQQLAVAQRIYVGGTGTSTIENNLQVNGTLQTGTGSIFLGSNFLNFNQSSALNFSAVATATIAQARHGFAFATSSTSVTPILAIEGSNFGRVGIGTSTATAKLAVAGGGLAAESLLLANSYASIMTPVIGSSTGYTVFSGGIGTGGADSIGGPYNNALRITHTGNLVNIGSIQGGELNLTNGGTFAAKVDYTTGTGPVSVVLGDVNGDGYADMAATNRGDGTGTTLSVLLNNGNGTFAGKVDYTTGTNPHDVTFGDVNGDGKGDIAVANYSSNSVSILLNNGNNTFAAKVDYTTGTNPAGVALGDVNGDGKADVVTGNNGGDTVSVFLNNGNGTFAAKVDYATTANGPYRIVLGDVNSDGKADIVATNYGASGEGAVISVFLNNGDGTFAAKVDYTTGASPFDVKLGDVDGDGQLDIATANYGANSTSIFLNNGNGTFAAKVDYTVGTQPLGIMLGDVNGDGKADIATANGGANTASILFNNGDGTFAAKVDYTTGTNPYDVAFGDINGDGKADIAVANLGLGTGSTVSVLLNSSSPMLYAKASSGNVGVGTSTPYAQLTIWGSGTGTGKALEVADNASTTRFVVQDNGNVGVGTSTPGALLAVQGNALISGTSTVGTLTATGSALFATAAGTNVGIGTTGPQAKLEVVNTSSAATATQLYLSNLASATNTVAQLAFRATDVGTTTAAQGNATTTAAINGVLNQNFNGGMGFLTFSTLRSGLLTEALRIDGLGLLTFTNATATQLTTTGSTYLATTGGNVGIGTTSPYAALSVVGSTGVVAQHYTATSTTATSSFMGALGIGTSTPAQQLAVAQRIYVGGTGTSTIENNLQVNGTLQTGTGSMFLGSNFLNFNQSSTLNFSAVATATIAQARHGFAFATSSTSVTPILAIEGSNFGRVGIGTSTATAKLAVAGGGFAAESLLLANSYTSIMTPVIGSSTGYTVFSGGLGTGGADSIGGPYNNALRITHTGNLVNIGSIQGGELALTNGGTFAAKVDYTTGTGPAGNAIGDINGDGYPDVAVVNFGAGAGTTVSIFINNGNGTFAGKVDYTTGTGPFLLAIGDVNGDGKADIVATNRAANTVSVLVNNGNNTFAAKVDYTTGTLPFGIALGDVNGDGKADMVIANYTSNTASVLINNGNGTFAGKVDYATGTGPYEIALGDVNGDGKADIATSNYAANTASILMNNGDGTFATKVDYTTGTSPLGIVLGDINSDGRLDMVVTNDGSNSVSVFTNNGNGTFAAKVDYTTGTGPATLALGDVNGDGEADIATANNGTGAGTTASVLINNGNGTFAAKVDYTTGTAPFGVALGDVNGDGKADIVTANNGSNTASVFLNSSSPMLYAKASSGNIGVGTSTPYAQLTIWGSGTGTGKALEIADNASTTRFVVQDNGLTGIGTTSPYAALSVVGSTGVVAQQYTATSTTATSSFMGALGIGTSTPAQQLAVAQRIYVGGTGTSTIENNLLVGGLQVGASSIILANNAISGSTNLTIQTTGSNTDLLLLPTRNVGIGSSTPYARLGITGNSGSTAPIFAVASSSNTNYFSVSSTGTTTIQTLQTGAMTFESNAGAVTWVDLSVTSSASAGTAESYSAQLDTNDVLTIYAESDGSGGIWRPSVGIGSSTPWGIFSIEHITSPTSTLPTFVIADSGTSTPSLIVMNATGRVGIATTSPGSLFSVHGNVLISNNLSVAGITATGTATLSGGLLVNNATSTITNLTMVNATSTAATTTHLAVTGTATMTGNLIANNSSSTITNLRATTVIAVDATTTSLAVSDIASTSKLLVTSPTATSTFTFGLQAYALNITSSVSTSTFANGINLSGGCFAINNTCVGGSSGTVNSGTAGQFTIYASDGTTISGTSTVFVATNSRVGVGSTTPWAKFSVQGDSGGTSNIFAVGTTSSSGATTTLLVDSRGFVGIGGTTTLTAELAVQGSIANTLSPTSGTSTVPASIGSAAAVGSPRVVAVSGRNAYVINDSATPTLQVFDISTTSPALIGSAVIGAGPRDIAVSGRYAYVANAGANTLQVFDISTSSPALVGQAGTDSGAREVKISGRYAYVVNNGGNTLQVFDISTSSPALVGRHATAASTVSVDVSGRYAYVLGYTANTLQVFDVSTGTPALIGSAATANGPFSVKVSGRYAYVANYDASTLQVFDISTTSPALVGSVATDINPHFLAVSGRYVYLVAVTSNTLQVFDVSIPSGPALVGKAGTGSVPRSVAVSGRYAYVTNTGGNTFQVFDVSGLETTSAIIHSLEAGNLQVRNNITANGQLQIYGGLNVGAGGIFSAGSIGVVGTSTFIGGIQIPAGGICVDSDGNCVASTSGRVSATSFVTAASDLAENYYSPEDLHPGDIVAATGGYRIGRADMNERGQLLGVVSTRPGIILGFDNDNPADRMYPIALTGRVPVRVNLEGGAIAVGDPVTISSVSGVGAKATTSGMVLGYALEAYNGSTTAAEIGPIGQILVFAKLGQWTAPAAEGSPSTGSGTSLSSDESFVTTTVKRWLASLSIIVQEAFIQLREIVVDLLTAKRITTNELQLKDAVTGELYCMKIANGEWMKTKGECGTGATSGVALPSESAAPAPEPAPAPAAEVTQPSPEYSAGAASPISPISPIGDGGSATTTATSTPETISPIGPIGESEGVATMTPETQLEPASPAAEGSATTTPAAVITEQAATTTPTETP